MSERVGNAGMSEEERLIVALHVFAQSDGGTPGQFLDTLAYITQDRTWEKQGVTLRAMLETPPPHGAGIKANDVLRLIQFTHPHETNNQAKHRALEKMRGVVRDELHEALGEHGGDRTEEQGNNITLDQRGTSETYTIRRLRRDRPDLADKVIAGELSANAAAKQAGFRRKMLQIPADVDDAASALRRHFTADERAQLAELLVGDD